MDKLISSKFKMFEPGKVGHTCKASIWEAVVEAHEFEASLSYIVSSRPSWVK
jgi:hypothetical protein